MQIKQDNIFDAKTQRKKFKITKKILLDLPKSMRMAIFTLICFRATPSVASPNIQPDQIGNFLSEQFDC